MKITLGTTYYNNPKILSQFVKNHIDYFDELIIVDDGSEDPAGNHIQDKDKIRLYRVPIDYGFNSHGCRNLIMKETMTDWTVLMDMDRIFIDPVFAVDVIKTKKLNTKTMYLFEMFSNIKDVQTLHPSVNDFLIHKDHFWQAGGYDEELIGVRTGDRQYRTQLKHFGNEQLLHGVQARFTRGPSIITKATSIYDKKATSETLRLIDRRMKNPEPNKKTLTFEWHRVF